MDLRRLSVPLTQTQKLTVLPLADAKAHSRIDTADDDDLVKGLIEAAYDFLSGPSGWLGHCCLLTESWEAFIPGGMGNSRFGFELPMRPLVGDVLTNFAFLQADGTTYNAIDTAVFYVRETETFARVERAALSFWPYFGFYNPRAYRVQFDAGFGDAAAVPSGIKLAMKMLVGHWYENRESTSADGTRGTKMIEHGMQALAGRYRVSNDHS